MSDTLTFSDILRRGLTVEWHEAVALVRGVGECLRVSVGESGAIPELGQIELSSDGRIDLVGTMGTKEPVRRMGQLLQASLGTSDPPAPLRLIISQAVAPSPTFGSLREFDEALAYFERPDRAAVLRGLFARAAAAPFSDSQAAPTLDTVAPLSASRTPRVKQGRSPALRRGLSAALILALGVAGVQYARVAGLTPSADNVAAQARRFSARASAAVLAGLSKVSERAGLGKIIFENGTAEPLPAGGTPTPTPAVGQPAPGSARPVARVPAAAASAASPPSAGAVPATIAAFDLEPNPPPAALAATPDAVAPERSSGASIAEAREPVDLTITYEPGSADVSPPVSIRPQLPRELPPDINRDLLTSIELTVLPDGSVESVRLVGDPRNMQDAMWLSAVKAWQFSPAMKNGVPVRYRKTIWIAAR